MEDQQRMKKITPFQTRYLRVLRKIKSTKPENLVEKTKTASESLIENFPEELGIKEAINKLWIQSIGVFENIIPENPKKSADEIRKIATAASNFLIEKYDNESGSFIKDVYKAAITQFLLLEDKELGKRIAKRIAMDGAENERKIEQEEIAKEILKMPFLKIKPKSGLF